MSCLQSRNLELMERYLRDELPASEVDSFESHVLECSECAEELQELAALGSELAHRREEIEAVEARRGGWGSSAWVALAAVLLLAAGLLFVIRPWSAGDLGMLAEIEPPAYQEAQLRGADGDAGAHFEAGMERYVEGDYLGAVQQLEAAAELEPERIDVQFFLGASRLLLGEQQRAVTNLDRVVAGGDTPYLEEAMFMRAQARLLKGEGESAAADLRAIIELEGDWERRATDQLEELEARLQEDR